MLIFNIMSQPNCKIHDYLLFAYWRHTILLTIFISYR